ncbi:MAG: HAD family hydrolase [Parafannyhessea sp.]|uniref:HAD family hydrolase n=1 Tax=Parafannyhessea sp. TaxID=2847324 RepID=UPI003F09ED00
MGEKDAAPGPGAARPESDVRPAGARPEADVRIVFADMDDTFLARDKSVPERNLALLDLLAEWGIVFVPCTGRPFGAVSERVLAHPATAYVVGSDGAAVTDVREKGTPRTAHLSALGKPRALALYDRVHELPVTFDVFWGGSIYVSRDRYDLMRGFDVTEYDRTMYYRYRTPVDKPTPALVEGLGGVERLTLYTPSPDVRAQAIAAIEADPTLHYTYSSAYNLEVMDANTSKGAAVGWLLAHLGIPREASVGFGDSPNDLPMMEAVGTGVAVANAYPEVRQAAADTAPWTCDEAAVARYMERLLG